MKSKKNSPNTPSSSKLSASSTEKFRTSREVLDRIRWDPSLNANAFTILYPDRLEGVRKIPFLEFIKKSDLMLHRIQQICIGDFVVWDRVQKVDRICGSGKTPQKEHTLVLEALLRWQEKKEASTSLTLVTEKKQTELFPVPAYRYQYDSAKWMPIENETLSFELPSNLVFITYNILMDWKSTGELLENQGRFPALLQIFQENEPDILALQEVTPQFLQKLLEQDWVRMHYFVSENTEAKTVSPYGQLLLSRYPFAFSHYSFSAHKKALFAVFSSFTKAIFLANVHLMSDRAQNAKVQRERQLQKTLAILSQLQASHLAKHTSSLSFILGDFNAKEESLGVQLESSGFKDVWKTLYPEKVGYTFDPQLNGIAAMNSLSDQPARFDQIWFSLSQENQHIHTTPEQPIEITQLGTEPLDEKFSATEFLFPSDHFGLCALFQFNTPLSLSKKTSTVQSALAIIPPEACWEAIQQIRKEYDPSYTRWMPHINLLYPFLPETCFEQTLPQIQELLQEFEPFSITFRIFRFFRHRQSTTIWIAPETDPPERLLALQAKLQKHFSDLSTENIHQEFTPHLTVARLPTISESEINNYLNEWQKNWQPISFSVQDIALMSRQKETPFSIKHLLSLPSKRSPQTNSDLFTQIKQLLQKKVAPLFPEASFTLYRVGSTRLGNAHKSSDIDLLCIGSASVPRDIFFPALVTSLKESNIPLQSSRIILEAIVPILKLSIADQTLDIQYVALPTLSKNPTLAQIKDIDFSTLERGDQYALASLFDAEALSAHIQNYGGNARFLETRALLKEWIIARDIHSNAFGFPGSFAWTLILASILMEAPLTDSPQMLFIRLLHFLTQHDYTKPITYNQKVPNSFAKNSSDTLLLILTPTPPYRNTTRGIIPTTQKILRQEVKRAWKLSQKEPTLSSEIFCPVQPIPTHPYFLFIQIESASAELLEYTTGWLEGHILHLFLEIEKQVSLLKLENPNFRPYSKRNNSSLAHSYFWLTGFFTEEVELLHEKLVPIFQDFLTQWKEQMPSSETLRLSLLDSKSVSGQFY